MNQGDSESSLRVLTQAEAMLANVRTPEEAFKAMTLAEMAVHLAKRLKLGTASVNHASRIKAEAAILLAEKTTAAQQAGQIVSHGGNRGNQHTGGKISSENLARLPVPAKPLHEARTIRSVYGTAEAVRNRFALATARNQELTTAKLYREAQRQSKSRNRPAGAVYSDGWEPDIRAGDVRDLSTIDPTLKPESIDVIVTDPPYPKEFVPLFADLSKLGARVLKPGGSLFALVGQSYLPEIMDGLSAELQYHWTVAYLTPGGQAVQLWQRSIITFWKPVLWFTKGPYLGEWHGDVVRSAVNDNDKRFHHWGQSESGMAALVEKYTTPDQLILDPFLGGGTTGVVALQLGRRFIGIDKDPEARATARQRMRESWAS